MKYILIHTLVPGITSPKGLRKAIDLVKEIANDPSSIVPGGKLLSPYSATNKWMQICAWEAPSAESFTKMFESLKSIGVSTEIIPVEDMSTALSKWEKSIQYTTM